MVDIFNRPVRRASRPLDYAGGMSIQMRAYCRRSFASERRKRIARDILIKGSLASAAIEGNTLSEKEVLAHMQGKLDFPPSKKYLQREVNNIADACNEIAEKIANHDPLVISPKRIKELNHSALRDLELNDEVIPGKIRTWEIFVGGYKGAPPRDCDYLLNEMCQWLDGETFQEAPPGAKLIYAIIKALLAHLYIAWIHPFGDGNGRTARLLEFQILLNSGAPGPAAHLLSNHYNQTRSEYYRQLDQASASGGDVIPFLRYSVQGFLDGLRAQLDLIRKQQWGVTWRNFVHETFKDKNSPAAVRQRHLVLDLSRSNEPTPISKIKEVSIRVGLAYHGKTKKTISRDIKTLRDMGLLCKEHGKVRANKETILSFLPIKADS